jgi:hypothetical protein
MNAMVQASNKQVVVPARAQAAAQAPTQQTQYLTFMLKRGRR